MIFVLIIINLFVFISGIVLSDQISNFETKTDNLRKINLSLEKEVANLGSLKFATEQAKKLGFNRLSLPQSLGQLGYAYMPVKNDPSTNSGSY